MSNRQWLFICAGEGGWCAPDVAIGGEALGIHTLLICLVLFFLKWTNVIILRVLPSMAESR